MDRRQAMLTAVVSPLALLGIKEEIPDTDFLPVALDEPQNCLKHGGPIITVHEVVPEVLNEDEQPPTSSADCSPPHDASIAWFLRLHHLRWLCKQPSNPGGIITKELFEVRLGHYQFDSFITWKRDGERSKKTLVILYGNYTAEKMAKELNMQLCPVHDCIKFVVQDNRCVVLPT